MTEVKSARGENFPVALRLLPKDAREHLMALYGYARFVDDLGDEPGMPARVLAAVGRVADGTNEDGTGADGGATEYPDSDRRLAALDVVEEQVRGIYAGRVPSLPAVAALTPTVRTCDLPLDPLLRLIEANRMDQIVSRYGTFEQLQDYCRLSADPVGELVLHIFGQVSPERVELSNRVCTALQIVEHLQDVAEDWSRDRVYLPEQDMDRFGVTTSDLGRERAEPALTQLIGFEAERASALLDSGAPLVSTLRGWARIAVGGYVAGGRAALAALARSGYDPLSGPVKASRWSVLGQWLRASVRSAG